MYATNSGIACKVDLRNMTMHLGTLPIALAAHKRPQCLGIESFIVINGFD